MRGHQHTTIDPSYRDRLRMVLAMRGWPRVPAIRRLVAATLMLLAVALALRPATADRVTTSAVVAAKDLPAGTTLAPADVTVRQVPRDVVPHGVLTTADAAVGQVLGSATRAGEPLTDVRLVGPANTRLASGDPNAAIVPVRLADPGVADLLHPGTRVDVVTLDPQQDTTELLATNATVVTVRGEERPADHHGRLVVIALPHDVAAKVAAYSLKQPVTVTLR